MITGVAVRFWLVRVKERRNAPPATAVSQCVGEPAPRTALFCHLRRLWFLCPQGKRFPSFLWKTFDALVVMVQDGRGFLANQYVWRGISMSQVSSPSAIKATEGPLRAAGEGHFASPSATRTRMPTWLNIRLVCGVLLLLVSVALGARVVASADHSTLVWAVRHDTAAGATLTAADIERVSVRLPRGSAQYFADTQVVTGKTLVRDVSAHELIPRGALRVAACGALVSIPVASHHLPPSVTRGRRVDVFASPRDNRAGQTERVLQSATVQDVTSPHSGLSDTGEWSLTVWVASDTTSRVVNAVRAAEIDVTLSAGSTTRTSLCEPTKLGGAKADPRASSSASVPPPTHPTSSSNVPANQRSSHNMASHQ